MNRDNIPLYLDVKSANYLFNNKDKVLTTKTFTSESDNILFNVMTEFVANSERIELVDEIGENTVLIKGLGVGENFLYYSKDTVSGVFECLLVILEGI